MSPCRSDHIFKPDVLPPGCGEAGVFGVWSLRILDAFLPMNSSVLAASVHRDGAFPKHSEPLAAEVLSSGHRSDDTGEDQEVLLLAAHEWLRLEETYPAM
jgi:hypothetical protein